MVFNESGGIEIRNPKTERPIRSAELKKWLKRIERKIDFLVGDMEKIPRSKRSVRSKRVEKIETGEILDVMALLSLPDHLRKSALAMVVLKRAMADDVARETSRARAIESAYLNQLARMGYLRKIREGRSVYFVIAANSSGVEHLASAGRGGNL